MGHTHYWYLRTSGREAVEKRTGPPGAVEAALLGAAKAFYDEAKE